MTLNCQPLIVFDQFVVFKLKRFLLHHIAHPHRRALTTNHLP
jgi:hypothetical protein